MLHVGAEFGVSMLFSVEFNGNGHPIFGNGAREHLGQGIRFDDFRKSFLVCEFCKKISAGCRYCHSSFSL